MLLQLMFRKTTEAAISAASVFTTQSAIENDISQHSTAYSLTEKLLLPIIVGAIVPFLKDWLYNIAKKRRDKRRLKKMY